MIVMLMIGMLSNLVPLASRLSKNIKRGTAIAALATSVILAGQAVSAQVNPWQLPPSLTQVKVPEPDNIISSRKELAGWEF